MFIYSRIQIEIELLDNCLSPDYWGTKLRGGFGHALKGALCSYPELKRCKDCSSFQRCDYPLIFKPQRLALKDPPIGQPLGKYDNLPTPFVLNPPIASKKELNRGDRLLFELIIFGIIKDKLSILLNALEEFGKHGIEHEQAKARFRIVSVRDLLQEGKSIPIHHSNEKTDLSFNDQQQIKSEPIYQTVENTRPATLPSSLTIHFITPVRVERTNPRRRDTVSGLAIFSDCYDFVLDLSNRVAELWQLYGDDWPGQKEFFLWQDRLKKASRQILWTDDSLKMERYKRFSTPQETKLPIDGFTGKIKLTGDFTQLWSLFRIGEILHVGQNTSFGFGRYLIF
jgi:hypothetical protein